MDSSEYTVWKVRTPGSREQNSERPLYVVAFTLIGTTKNHLLFFTCIVNSEVNLFVLSYPTQ